MNTLTGLYYCNIERDNELNTRLFNRNVPSAMLQPQFSMRPVSSKYATLPILDGFKPSTVQINRLPTYSVKQVFNPGSSAPWSGFSKNINTESTLRNQFFALQHCDQSKYIPSSTSDMFSVEVTGRKETQPFPGLFDEKPFEKFNPNTCNVGGNLFNNSTREQLLSSECCKNIC